MKHAPPLFACLLLGLLTASYASEALPAESAPHARIDSKHKALLQDYCVRCHGPEKQKGKLRLDQLPFEITNLETAEKWQKVLNQMNSGDMPPDDEKQPPREAKTELLDDLANVMVAARRNLGDQNGVITMRRLNRREYKNTLRELLGVDVNVTELPSDSGTGGFDTVGANLFMSGNQFEQYQALGRDALEEAFALHASAREREPAGGKTIGQIAQAEPKFSIGDNRQVNSVSAPPGVDKVRFECETANEKVAKYVAKQIDARERARRWVKAVDEAAAKPENAAIVAEIRKTAKNDAIFRRSWEKINGAPSPRSFGFNKFPENDADLANDSLGPNWQSYHEYYLRQPALDRGAYLGTPTMHPAVMALGFLQLPVPNEWHSGEYIFRVKLAATKDAPPERRFLEAGMHPRNGEVRATFQITGTMEQPQIVEMPFTLTRTQADPGDRTLFIREKGAWDNNEEGGRKRAEAVKRNGIGPETVLWIDWMEIEHKEMSDKDMPPGLRALNIALDDKSPPPSKDELRAALVRFAREAFRETEPPASYVERLLALYEMRLKAGDKHTAALKETLSVVLASPMFLYLAEPAVDGKFRPLTGIELATRLSYFLWGAPPDAELRDLARNGELLKPGTLLAQTDRLLDDPRSEGFVHPFLYQWLSLDRLDFFQFNRALYPRFDDSTKLAAKNEVYETFSHLLQCNGSLRELLKSDYVVINSVLANYYGIPGVTGDAFQKVSLPAGSPRGGFLGMAAILAMGGNGERTSPVERGAWILRKVLNDPTPPAPANVPQIARLAGQLLTTRERMKAHQEEPQCASCHRKIDPIGFGLENFDAAGAWRTEDTYQVTDAHGKPIPKLKKTWTIDPSAAFYRGPAFKDFFEMRDIIASKSDAFARGFSMMLIEYALGRPVGFRDEPLIAGMQERAGKKNLAPREFIHALVTSKEFHTK